MGRRYLVRVQKHECSYGCTGLSECFPDGVFYVECGQGAASTYRLLLDSLRGQEYKEQETKGNEPQDIKTRLQRELQGQQCLIWLDNVQDKEVLAAFRARDFPGALLVTAVQNDIWEGLSDCRKTHVSHNIFWAASADSSVAEGDKIAARILSSRAANDVCMTQFAPGCEVGPQYSGCRGKRLNEEGF